MSGTREERLEAMRLELASQDEQWQGARRALEALGDVQIAVPPETLEEIDAACTVRAAAVNIAAIRG